MSLKKTLSYHLKQPITLVCCQHAGCDCQNILFNYWKDGKLVGVEYLDGTIRMFDN